MRSIVNPDDPVLLDAGVFIGALLREDARHEEARRIVDAAREGRLRGCLSVGILSEVYAALTWVGAQPPHSPEEAAQAARAIIEPPSGIRVLSDGLEAGLKTLELAAQCHLTARRTHDARHAATALTAGVHQVCTYDEGDWKVFQSAGIFVVAPSSVLALLWSDKLF
jgi:predicted nucleic acid-binding protein